MEILDQAAHIDAEKRKSVEREEKMLKIQNLYEHYIKYQSQNDFTELIQLVEQFSHGWVYRHLRDAGCYNDENEHTALQEARVAIWEMILQSKNERLIRQNFGFYAIGIYKNKTYDVIRKTSRKRSKFSVTSIDEKDDNDKSKENELPPFEEDFGALEEKRFVYDKLFRLYCRSFMNSKTFPPRCLALYYARVLPHLLSEIPDTKGASAKWAVERMDSFSIWFLTQDSEKTLQNDIDKELAWGNEYLDQMNDELYINGKSELLKNIIYTSVYDKGQIEDWSEYMHRATIKEAKKLLLSDKDLLELVKEYVTTERIMRRFLNNKEDKHR